MDAQHCTWRPGLACKSAVTCLANKGLERPRPHSTVQHPPNITRTALKQGLRPHQNQRACGRGGMACPLRLNTCTYKRFDSTALTAAVVNTAGQRRGPQGNRVAVSNALGSDKGHRTAEGEQKKRR
eukprot:1158975-Pelagomonas_calceolata.AAC.3